MRSVIKILSVIVLLTLASVVSAQTPLTCGIVGVEGPSKVAQGEPLVFKARTNGVSHTTKTELKWKLSAGTITAGQGTDEISVDTAGLDGNDVIATVELFGAPLGCNGSASKTTQIEAPAILCYLPSKFDEYGDLKFKDEKARLDNFAIQLSSAPLLVGYIIMTAGQETYENETTERLDRIRSYLVNVRKVDGIRLVTVDCGFTSDPTISFYIASPGADPPCNTFSAIPLSEVKFTKPRPKASKKKR
ncbi:MAG TPA: hypothetical protein VJP89_22965 [Pyrinomonadaceae bacterium]|nr:hypothetical protein [Pyrinomonadaceae bacterium]